MSDLSPICHPFPGVLCFHCRRPTILHQADPQRAQTHRWLTRDHILPRAWGGRLIIHDDVSNWRWMCRRCNGRRAAAGHCLAALACIEAIAETEIPDWAFHEAMTRTGMHAVTRAVAPTHLQPEVSELR
jgi:hypothetical protein